MRTDSLRKLLQEVRNGQLGIENALTKLKALPYENLGFARINHHRDLRKGFPAHLQHPFVWGASNKQNKALMRIYRNDLTLPNYHN